MIKQKIPQKKSILFTWEKLFISVSIFTEVILKIKNNATRERGQPMRNLAIESNDDFMKTRLISCWIWCYGLCRGNSGCWISSGCSLRSFIGKGTT